MTADLVATVVLGCVAGLCAVTANAQPTAQQVTRTGHFELPCSADTAFPLFGPEGERVWVPGWDPRPVYPAEIKLARDTVFREGSGSDEAMWTIVAADAVTHRVEYVRLSPQSHTGHIVVRIEPLGPERSRVFVSYTVTAFGNDAPELVAAFSPEAYAAKMRHWQEWISRYLTNRKK